MSDVKYQKSVERWDVLEVEFTGKKDGNPFVDSHVTGVFSGKNETKTAEGFYDGDGVYKVRFMPSFTGSYSFTIKCNFMSDEIKGEFEVTPAGEKNHGPVHVANTFHFAYEDGTKYYPVGTTCYVWELQNEKLQKQTLESLAKSSFNKIRFCIFPKHYVYNFHEPIMYPYEGTPCDTSKMTEDNFKEYIGNAPGNNWDFEKFVPAYFRHIEDCIKKLSDLEIEADLIVMHPYDRWGFSCMDEKHDDLYWHYVVARFAAYRNVWWSLANEYDLMQNKSIADWERYAQILCDYDPYTRLRSIHNWHSIYDFTRPWVTHCCVQRVDMYKVAELVNTQREQYKKPVILDEMAYEGNIQHGWGNISGKELMRRFWEAACRGGYGAHAETFVHPDNILWWSHGGVLHGESEPRIAFLKKIMYEVPGHGLRYYARVADEVCATLDGAEERNTVKKYYLCYYSFQRPSFRDFYFDDTTKYKVEVIDTWEMTITDAGVHSGKFRIQLPGKEYIAVRMTKVE